MYYYMEMDDFMAHKFDGILLCTDMDHTLRNSQGTISEENKKAINWFMEQGGLFSVCTGRRPGYISQNLEGIVPNVPIVTLNGACLYDMQQDNILDSLTLPEIAEKALRIQLEREWAHIRYMNFECKNDGYSRSTSDFTCSPEEIAKAVISQHCNTIMITYDSQEKAVEVRRYLTEMKEFCGKLAFLRSWELGVETIGNAQTKKGGIERLKSLLGSRVRKTVCVGDFENDIPMLQAADIGYAVENACLQLKQLADRITVSNDDHAIAAIIRELAHQERA